MSIVFVSQVRYWSDGTGFHQEDNIPKVVLKPVEEAEDVRQARLAHEKAWQEAAAAARKQPDPQSVLIYLAKELLLLRYIVLRNVHSLSEICPFYFCIPRGYIFDDND